MVPAPRQGVRRFALLLSALFLFPAATLGQPWLDAYETGNYTRAADLLHELVADPDALTTVSPIIPQTLADMYARGAGVQPDPIMACTLAEFAQGRALSTGGEQYIAETRRAEQLVEKYCTPLNDEQRPDAHTGCMTFGLQPQVIEAGGRQILVTSRGLTLPELPSEVMVSLQCMLHVAAIRTTTVQPPDNAIRGVRPRHFAEVFTWAPTRKGGTNQRTLLWLVVEVRDKAIAPVVSWESLIDVPGRAWPPPGLPEGLESRLSFDMIRSGQVRWRLQGAKPRHGWILLPETEPQR